MVGIDKNIPDNPQIISPKIIPKNVSSAFSFTFDPTMVGNRKLASTAWIPTILTPTYKVWLMLPVANVNQHT